MRDQVVDAEIARIRAWRRARVLNYVSTRSPEALASMLVELEDATGSEPEFLITDNWGEHVITDRQNEKITLDLVSPYATVFLDGVVAEALDTDRHIELDWRRDPDDPDVTDSWVARWTLAENPREVAVFLNAKYAVVAVVTQGWNGGVPDGTWLWIRPAKVS